MCVRQSCSTGLERLNRAKAQNNLPAERTLLRLKRGAPVRCARPYFGGAGVKTSRLCAGSGLGFGLGAFLVSFLPLSLLPMAASVPQKGGLGEGKNIVFQACIAMFVS